MGSNFVPWFKNTANNCLREVATKEVVYLAKMNAWIVIASLVALFVGCESLRLTNNNGLHAKKMITSTRLGDASFYTSLLQKVEPSQARGEFYFFFFAGSGALGIGFAQLPKLLEQYQAVQDLAGGPTAGGETVECGPLATIGYPEPLRKADVQYILDNMPSTQAISAKGKKASYMSQLGYLEREAFYQCLPKANPLAMYAVFEALAEGSGDLAAPQTVSAIYETWQQQKAVETGGDVKAFSNALQKAFFRKYSAYTVFLFLIGLVLDLIIESGIQGFLSE